MKVLFALSYLLTLACCAPAPKTSDGPKAANGRPQVYVANYPLKYFAQRLGADLVEVHFPAPADEDPAFWQPDDATLAKYQAADLILMNGASYSKWVDTTTLPDEKVVNTGSAYSDQYIEVKDATTHSHGPGGEHSHSGTAFTTWLDLRQASLQAQEVSKALQTLVPEKSKKAIADRYKALKKDLDSLDQRLLAVGKRLTKVPFVASHPVYQYMARRYNLDIQSVLWEPETVPDDKAMAALQALLAKHPAKWMLWEGEPDGKSVDKLQAIGVQSMVIEPCANVPETGDFLDRMTANIESLETAFP